jgi:hypothetical protein
MFEMFLVHCVLEGIITGVLFPQVSVTHVTDPEAHPQWTER